MSELSELIKNIVVKKLDDEMITMSDKVEGDGYTVEGACIPFADALVEKIKERICKNCLPRLKHCKSKDCLTIKAIDKAVEEIKK